MKYMRLMESKGILRDIVRPEKTLSGSVPQILLYSFAKLGELVAVCAILCAIVYSLI